MGHLIAIDPRDVSVIDVGDLEHAVSSWITSAAFAEDDLTHPPSVIECLCDLLCCLDDHKITRLNAEKSRRTHALQWTNSCGCMINAHQYT